MNKTNELNTQGLKLDNFRNIEKIGLKAIMQDPTTWNQVSQTIDKLYRQKDQDGNSLFESNRKLWDKVTDFNHDFGILKDLKIMFENGTLDRIYTQYLANRSDIMEFKAENTKVYMNETADNHLTISPIEASCMTITYRDFKGDTHTIEGVLYAFISDYKPEAS